MNVETMPKPESLALADVRGITLRAPWAWAIIHGGKRLENRKRTFRYRGPVLIHAGNGVDRGALEDFPRRFGVQPDPDFPRGAVVGIATVIGCVSASNDRWFIGPHALVLADVQSVPPVRCPGQLGMWRPAPDVLAAVAAALG